MLLLFFFFLYDYYSLYFFFFSSRRRHTRWNCDWSSDVCSSDLGEPSCCSSVERCWRSWVTSVESETSALEPSWALSRLVTLQRRSAWGRCIQSGGVVPCMVTNRCATRLGSWSSPVSSSTVA